MEGDMVKCMEQARERRLARELRRTLHGRWNTLEVVLLTLRVHPKAILHGLSHLDIALMPEVREVICAPSDAEVTEDSFAAVRDRFDEHAERWKEQLTEQLRALVVAQVKRSIDAGHREDLPAGVDPLDFAAITFSCGRCGYGVEHYYPQILEHRHDCYPSPDERGEVYSDFVLRQLKQAWMSCETFMVDKITVKSTTSDRTRALFELCGAKDPVWPTAGEMDALDVRLVLDETKLMTWRAAVRISFSFSGVVSCVLTARVPAVSEQT